MEDFLCIAGSILKKIKYASTLSELKIEITLAFLAIFTIVVIIIKPYIIITNDLPIHQGKIGLRSDSGHDKNKGQSFGEFIDNNKFHFKCTIVKSNYRTPYCGLAMATTSSWTKGVDISGYESIIFDIDYYGKSKTARFYLRNFNPDYSHKKEMSTTKYHIIEFETALLSEPFEVKLSHFKVADWWIARNNIPFALSGNELTNIVIAQLQTGTLTKGGEQTFKINSIKLKKNAISDTLFNILFSSFWLTASFVLLLLKILKKNKEIKNQKVTENKLKQEKETLSKKAQTDELTNTLNRHGADNHFTQLIYSYGDNSDSFVSLIFLDIDHFKKINDNAGHTVGDAVLKELSELIRNRIRSTDKLIRWGGEEFILICKKTKNKDAERLAKALRQSIEEHIFCHRLNVTASFGVYTERLIKSTNLISMSDKADIALYEAKNTGRNTVINYNTFEE